MKTIDYYNKHAEEFTTSTFEVDMKSLYQPFLAELPEGARILDVGCGSGRDTLAFKNKGYQVDAIDYSEELVKKATRLTGIPIKLKSFYEVDDYEAYDGIWACASLLHCERSRLLASDEFLHKWQERNEEQDLIIVDRISVLGFLTDKERSHKVAEWAYAQGKENNYFLWNG